jgi:hypothetical protein
MSNFLSYQNIDFRFGDQNYYASNVSLSAQASVDAVMLNDGSLLDYAPNGAVIGGLSVDFYLTGSLPSFLQITGTNESSVDVSFAGVKIDQVYAKSVSFSVEPFQPIVISAEFDWYGNVSVENFNEQSKLTLQNKLIPDYIANGYKSFITTSNIEGVGFIVSFDYNMSCDRPAYFNVDEVFPFRVAKLNKKAEMSIKSNTLGDLLSIDGKSAITNITLKDTYGTSLEIFKVSGILTSQNYDISEGQYLLASAKITQTISETKTLI